MRWLFQNGFSHGIEPDGRSAGIFLIGRRDQFLIRPESFAPGVRMDGIVQVAGEVLGG
jgi:hypothetical protein